MKKITPLVLGGVIFSLLFTSTSIKAQDKELADSSTFKGFGKHALQFQVHDFFDISEFQGGVLSYKYHFDDKNAVRIGVDLDGESRDEETDENFMSKDTLYGTRVDVAELIELHRDGVRTHENISLLIQAQYIRYFAPYQDIKVFGGIGPDFHYSNRSETRTLDSDSRNQETFIDTTLEDDVFVKLEDSELTYDQSKWAIGLDAVFGVEWFFHEHLSLTAEYGFNITYEQFERDITNKRKEIRKVPDQTERRTEFATTAENTETDGWRFYDNRVKLGLTVYFGQLLQK